METSGLVLGPDGLCVERVIEDELLAALPMAPAHSRDVGCVVPGKRYDEAPNSGRGAGNGGPVNRPFSDLAALMGSGTDQRED